MKQKLSKIGGNLLKKMPELEGNQIRPELTASLSSQEFRKFYYLKEELVNFCKAHGIPASGSKALLNEKIEHFLGTGEILKSPRPVKKRATKKVAPLTPKTLIEDNFACSQQHREFFKEQIGSSFSFKVAFQNWLKENTGKTYAEAIEAYYEMKKFKPAKKQIDSQFEYNTYIRDFFAANQGSMLKEAIACWKYKKALPGHNRYEAVDKKLGL